ncbi:uncharacterized protein LOC132792486 [Drosophila nasuta]|uniref:uncharacterized protein LOC132792486 n=1 Tax=Drosophila nasuta TaxID=42062 RepID=UPI00295EA208|nr:uncharacterized protein LOC132792486 [Drosophila nasuta]
MFLNGPNYNKLKINLRKIVSSCSRKRNRSWHKNRERRSQILSTGKTNRVEHIIREDYLVEDGNHRNVLGSAAGVLRTHSADRGARVQSGMDVSPTSK